MYGSSPLRSTLNTGYITALDMCEVCTETVHSVALWTRATSQLLDVAWSMYPSSALRSTLNTGYITALDMCEVCTEAVHSVALWTRVTSQLWSMNRSSPFCSTLNTGCIYHSFGHVWNMHRSSPLRKYFEHGLHHSFGHVWSMYRSSPLRSTLNTGYITALDMCEVCTEAVHSVALWTRVTSQVTRVNCVPKQSIP